MVNNCAELRSSVGHALRARYMARLGSEEQSREKAQWQNNVAAQRTELEARLGQQSVKSDMSER